MDTDLEVLAKNRSLENSFEVIPLEEIEKRDPFLCLTMLKSGGKDKTEIQEPNQDQ